LIAYLTLINLSGYLVSAYDKTFGGIKEAEGAGKSPVYAGLFWAERWVCTFQCGFVIIKRSINGLCSTARGHTSSGRDYLGGLSLRHGIF
jgi:hypothetical protein